ncbi:MAG: Re/Si-specific NAD(P)(+) transhydrogenase subunit alpha, partial [Acidobacteriaceae bacterium]|nr:Re/Si-specific NAD(P)(+) transhydrogenase subunit alpha [Acidobacteriaceae bacterium]
MEVLVNLGLTVGVLRETWPGERRVAMAPKGLDALAKMGAAFCMESGAGVEAGFPDREYEAKGATILPGPKAVLEKSQVILGVRLTEPVPPLTPQHTWIGFCDPLSEPNLAQAVASRGAALFSMEFVPRITRAQSMDALSSMASIAGYKAVLVAASALPRMFPMMMTAAGTVPPARVFVIGAGVAGLQAIATARRLGAVVSAYDVREAVREEIQSLGAKFVNITLGAKAEGQGGYAKQLDEETYRKQREQMTTVLREQDVIITTAAVPGKKAPMLVTRDMVHEMSPGSVVVDMAAERGGNCELTKAGQTVVENGVSILGPVNIPASVPYHASQMYARNLSAFLKNTVKNGELVIDLNDEITR